MNNNNRIYIYLPILLALVLCLGLYMGSKINFGASPNISNASELFTLPTTNRFNKLNEVINYIENEYVDTVQRNYLVDKAIAELLQDLDPHSYYISPEELQALNEPLEGNFDGIGVEFNIQKDTVVVISPIVGGPSEMLGILPGDRIVEVEGNNIAGNGITNSKVIKLLRGKRGSIVEVGVLRKGESELLDFKITRDKIPIFSIDVSYKVNDEIGYIKVSRFAKTTYKEFVNAGVQLKAAGAKKMIIDLRQNGGGFLDAAIRIADEFLTDGELIVYTEGKARPKESYYATDEGRFEGMEVAVLIDEGSASASEIIAGAIQDNDRGTVIGRRSFGKGLVQEQSDWPDGSAIRLTIARYYTPTGRSIQKPYDGGSKKYYQDYYDDLQDGSFQSPDSSDFPDSLKYKTPKGKVVYGGGGIMPDIYVPSDTLARSRYFVELMYRGLVRQFAFDYADANREELSNYGSFEKFNKSFVINQELYSEFISYAKENGARGEAETPYIESLIKSRLKANISRNIWNNEGYYPVLHKYDKTFQKALDILSSDKVPTTAEILEN